MKPLNIDVKRTGFPVTVGGIEFFFSTDEQNILKFMKMQDDPEVYAKEFAELKKRVEGIEMPKDGEHVSLEDFETVIETQKEAGRIIFDVMLGKGAFDTLYSVYGDIRALMNLTEPLAELIAEGLEDFYKTEYKDVQESKTITKAKKSAKRKKASGK